MYPRAASPGPSAAFDAQPGEAADWRSEPSPPSVAIVCDERSTASAIRTILGDVGATSRILPSVELAAGILAGDPPDLVVLGVDGDETSIAAVRTLRRSAGALLAIGPRSSVRLTCAVLDAGADDWLVAPFHPEELRARCASVLRWRHREPRRRFVFGPLEIDVEGRTATAAGRPFAFTRSDWSILDKLARRPGQVVPHAELGGGELHSPDTQHALARARIGRLRRRFAEAGAREDAIRVAEGRGYRLEVAER